MKTIAILALIFLTNLHADDKDYDLYNTTLQPQEELGSCPGGNCRNLKHIHNPALDPDTPN